MPGRQVIGIEPDETLARSAAKRLDQVLPLDALDGLNSLQGPLDCIIFADVLEHLSNPEAVLQKASSLLAGDGKIVVSLPNSAWAPVLHAAAAGRWDLTLAGVQARDHWVPMTPASFASMAARAGLRVEQRVPFALPLPWRLRCWAWLAAWTAGGQYSDLAAPQWVIILRSV
jgi:2-polyprenyl-3-methyl-5-hydroxy-6-metoxy-1,4-benzoquinol methylase